MAIQSRTTQDSGSVGFSCPSRAGRRLSTRIANQNGSYTRRNRSDRVQRSADRPQHSRYVGFVAALTVAALVVGLLKGGLVFAAILAAIALAECFALIAHARNAANT